jgi:hypothetical protein
MNIDFSNPLLWRSNTRSKANNRILSPTGSLNRKSSDPPLASPLSNVSNAGNSGLPTGTSLVQAFLDQDSPQLNPAICDFLLDGGLAILLDFIVRPIGSSPHAVSSLGQDALAAVAAKTVARVSASKSLVSKNEDRDCNDGEIVSTSIVVGNDRNKIVEGEDASSSTLSRSTDYSVYGVSSFAVKEAALGSGGKSLFARTQLSSSSGESLFPTLPLDDEDDGEPSADMDEGIAALHRSSIGGGSSSSLEIIEMSRSVIQAHAATFSAAVADLANVKDVFLNRQHDPSGHHTSLSSSSSSSSLTSPISSSTGEPHSLSSPSSSSTTTLLSSPPPSSSRSPNVNSSSTNRVRGYSLLSPRNSEEVDALKRLANMIEEDEVISGKVYDNEIANDSNRNVEETRSFSLPSPSELRDEEQNEIACVKRSYRAMRILSTGSSLIEEVTSQRVEEIAHAMLSVFSSRNKGSFTHACAVLQRLLQSKPEEMASFLASDTQRHLGGLLNFLHHPPVADTLLQLVTVNHLSSASGGAGPNATLNGPNNNGGGMGGGFGRGMVGGGLAFLSGFSGLGGGGGGDGKPSLTTYNAPLTIYGTRANSTSIPLPITRGHVMKSLGGWGFLSVLAAHVYRPEFAASSDHCENAADVFVFLLHNWATEERADNLFQALASDQRVLRGLATAAMITRPGIDFDPLTSSTGVVGVIPVSSIMPPRQRASMRVLNELASLSFKPLLPHLTDAAGSPLQIGVQPTLVENRLYKHAPVIGETLVAFLPRLAATLGLLHRKLHPDVPLLAQKKASGSGAGCGSGSGAVSALSASVTAANAEKKKKKKKKGKNKAGGSGGQGATNSLTSSTSKGSEGGNNVDDDEEDDGDEGGKGGSSSLSHPGSPTLLPLEDTTPSSALVPEPVIALPPVSAAITTITTTKLQQAASGSSSTTLTKSISTSSTQNAHPHQQHYQTRHSVSFGFYRLHAVQLFALALNEANVKVHPPLRGIPLPESPDFEKLMASTALASHNEEGGSGIEDNGLTGSTTTSRSNTSRDDAKFKDDDIQHIDDDNNNLRIASLATGINAINLQSSSATSSTITTTSRSKNQIGDVAVTDGTNDVDGGGGEDDDDDVEEDDDEDDDDDSISLSVTSSTSRRRGGGSNHGKKKNGSKKKKNSGKKHHHYLQQQHNQHGGGNKMVKKGSENSESASSPQQQSPSGSPAKGSGSLHSQSRAAAASTVSVSQAAFAILSSATLLFPRRAIVILRKQSETVSDDEKIHTRRTTNNRVIHNNMSSSLSESGLTPVHAAKTIPLKQQQSPQQNSDTNSLLPASVSSVNSGSVLDGVSASLAAKAVSSFTQSATLTSSALSGGVNSQILLSPLTCSPVSFDPLDLWACLCTWVTLYPNTNLYHVAFLEIVSSVLKNSIDENAIKAQFFMFSGARLISNFIKHYREHEPSPPSALRSRFVSPAHKQQIVPFTPSIIGSSRREEGGGGGGSSTAIVPSTSSSILDARRGGRPSALSTAHSSARGAILKTLDLVRQLTTSENVTGGATSSSSSSPSDSGKNHKNQNQHTVNSISSNNNTSLINSAEMSLPNNNNISSNAHHQGYLKQFLRDHTLWAEFQDKLKADLAVNSRPLIQTAQQHLRSNSATNAGRGGEAGFFGGGGGGGGSVPSPRAASSDDSSGNSANSPSFVRSVTSLFGYGGGGGGVGGGSSSLLSIGKQPTGAARGQTATITNSLSSDLSNQNIIKGGVLSSSTTTSTATTAEGSINEKAEKARAAMLATYLKKQANKEAMKSIKVPVVGNLEGEESRDDGGGGTRGSDNAESPPLSSPTISSNDLLDVD